MVKALTMARVYRHVVEAVLQNTLCEGKAASLASKFSVVAIEVRLRVGRTNLHLIYRQAKVPQGQRTWWTSMGLQWWSAWLDVCDQVDGWWRGKAGLPHLRGCH